MIPDLQSLDITVLAIPAFIVLMLSEGIAMTRRQFADLRGYEVRDTAASLTMGIVNVLISAVSKGALYLLFAWIFVRTPISAWDPRSPWSWVAILLVTDLCFYWFHRIHHEVRFFWAAHVNHHSSKHFNLSTALRQSWMTPFTGVLFYLPLPLLGFSPDMIIPAVAINTVYQFWIHTEAVDRLGPLEWIINTPSHHRVHHGRNLEYLDRNYAGMFIVWDRLFGTYEPEKARADYGLTKNIDTFNPVKIAFHDYADMLRSVWSARSPRDALNYIVQPPGWSPDGSTLTARQMRRRVESGLSPTPVSAAPASARGDAVAA